VAFYDRISEKMARENVRNSFLVFLGFNKLKTMQACGSFKASSSYFPPLSFNLLRACTKKRKRQEVKAVKWQWRASGPRKKE
jgi:hypothetical protein